MASWEKTDTVLAIFESFNQRFPNRAKGSDGTIGDTAHSTSKSGHNPDKPYPLPSGGRPEFEDNDGRAEVRAADITADLNDPEFDMQDACDAIRADSDDRERLAYMIYNRRIASASTSPPWEWRPYSGDSPHTEHAHFSSTPSADNDSTLFESITNLGGNMAHDALDGTDVANVKNAVIGGINQRFGQPVDVNAWGSLVGSVNAIKIAIDGLVAISFTDDDAATLRTEMQAAHDNTVAEVQAANEASATRDQQIMELINSAEQPGTSGATAREVLAQIAALITPADTSS